jgi:hypothetical protein
VAVRPVFLVQSDSRRPFRDVPVTFQWHAGLAVSQKQKSIKALHLSAKANLHIESLLEISSKSPDAVGVELSAFNLVMSLPDGQTCSVEAAYQGSKVTASGGPYVDIFGMRSLEAKRDERLKGKALTRFRFFGLDWPLRPATLFYDWLYISALCQPPNSTLMAQLLRYEGFTDIEFNPQRQVSCQARAAAILCGLVRGGVSSAELSSGTVLADVLERCYEGSTSSQQDSLFL